MKWIRQEQNRMEWNSMKRNGTKWNGTNSNSTPRSGIGLSGIKWNWDECKAMEAIKKRGKKLNTKE